jgi:hypothetical protein
MKKRPPGGGAFGSIPSAGGGTRTPDTRIMILIRRFRLVSAGATFRSEERFQASAGGPALWLFVGLALPSRCLGEGASGTRPLIAFPAVMASRKEEKERLRAQRLERQEAEQKATRRRVRLGLIGGGVLAAIVVVVIVVVAVSGGSSSGSSSGGQEFVTESVPSGAEVGVRSTPPPWPPDYAHLAERIEAMGLPGLSDTIFHIHAQLHVYVNGKPVQVPADIGLDEATGTSSPLHTHDTSGVIHMEADETYSFTLGQFLTVWGVKFSKNQLGSYKSHAGETVQVYDNGKPVKGDPVNLVMHEHDNIVVAYGKPGSFPTEPPTNFTEGE